ncbi:MAG: hypothetical protein AB7O50_16020 [Pseudolabrys sp.]
MSKFMVIGIAAVIAAVLALPSSAAAQQCGRAGSVEACVACLKKKGTTGPTGGWRWCSENVPKANAAKANKKKN